MTARPSATAAAFTGLGEVRGPSAPPLVRPGDDEGDVVTVVDERLQRRHRHGRRAEEDEPLGRHGGPRRLRRRRRPCAFGVLPCGQAAPLASSPPCAGRRHALEHEHAVEVVELVLEQPRHELVGLDLDLVAVEVEPVIRTSFGRTIST